MSKRNGANARETTEQIVTKEPRTREELRSWVIAAAGLWLPEQAECPHHQTPLDYLVHSFFERRKDFRLAGKEPPAEPGTDNAEADGGGGDSVVWACRGGGKTMIGAVATLLDLLFKPGIQIRIIGGSLEQSEKMYTYLMTLVNVHYADQLAGVPTRRRLRLKNGSGVEILAQSARAVRGVRVQKVRCDEIELFDPKVWKAVQLTTRSMMIAPALRSPAAAESQTRPRRGKGCKKAKEEPALEPVRGAIEVFSTMHEPNGLMRGLCKPEDSSRRQFTWCIWDVIAKCHAGRKCRTCPLHADCQGRAKKADGFVPVADVMDMYKRVSRGTWENEMLCFLPYNEKRVFAAFDGELHTRAFPGRDGMGPLPRPGDAVTVNGRTLRMETVIAGVDPGFSCFVCLWIAMLRDAAGRRVAWVVDEYVKEQRTLESYIAAIRNRPVDGAAGPAWEPEALYCDVAGRQVDAHSGLTTEALLRRAGFKVRSRAMAIADGIGAINELLDPAMNHPCVVSDPIAGTAPGHRFFIDLHCRRLIAAMGGYERGRDGQPRKDGVHDHLIDALRYALVNHDGAGKEVKARGVLILEF